MALEQAQESGEFDGEPGKPGTTPHIGDNGNWYIGETDTGIPAQGKPGSNANVTADSIRNALGYTPVSDGELQEIVMQVANVVAMKPTNIQGAINGNEITIEGYTAEQITELSRSGEVVIYGYGLSYMLLAKCYYGTVAHGVLYTLNYDDTIRKAENCIIELDDGETPNTVTGVIMPAPVVSAADKTEIAEQAAALVDTALLDLIGEVTE